MAPLASAWPHRAIILSFHPRSPWLEMVINETKGAKKTLRLPGRLAFSPVLLSPSRRLVRGLRPMGQPFVLPMLTSREVLAFGRPTTAQLTDHDHTGHRLPSFEPLAHRSGWQLVCDVGAARGCRADYHAGLPHATGRAFCSEERGRLRPNSMYPHHEGGDTVSQWQTFAHMCNTIGSRFRRSRPLSSAPAVPQPYRKLREKRKDRQRAWLIISSGKKWGLCS